MDTLEKQNERQKKGIKEKQKQQQKKVLLFSGIAMASIQAILSIALIVMASSMKIVAPKYIILASVLLAVCFAITLVTQKWTIPGIITKILAIIMCVVLAMATVSLGNIKSALNKITGENTKTTTVGVYVKAEASENSIEQLNGATCGKMREIDAETTQKAIEHFQQENVNMNMVDKENIVELVKGLLDDEYKAIMVNTSFMDILSSVEELQGVQDKLKLVDKYDVTTVIEEETKASEDKQDTKGENDSNQEDVLSSEDILTVYVSGVDTRGEVINNSNSDVNIIVSINKKTHQILMINTPRDYFVPLTISNGVRDKLTHAGIYGVDVSMGTLEMLYGVNIDRYVKVNFVGFKNIIDAIGGIDVYLDYSGTLNQTGHLEVYKGWNHFNGEQALVYARERYAYSDGDRQRGRNQMEVIKACITKITTDPGAVNFASLLSTVSANVVSNISYDELVELSQLQQREDAKWNVKSVSADGTGKMTTPYSMPGYTVYVMVPDESTVTNVKNNLKALYNGDTLQ